MKKIININLSGRVIPIEDSAFEQLQGYIESLRRYFAREEGRDEIINDIESRIAELMNEKIRKGAAAVTGQDVDEIIASMGRPEDFEEAAPETEKFSAQPRAATGTSGRKRRRLYRDTSDKFLGGVCSGIANYLNTDPAIIRILFAIITFGGFGLGFLIYILLWIFLPGSDLDTYSGKRLFRNPDDKIIGGVAGGLAAYFNMKTSTVRLIFAAPFVLSILISILDNISWDNNFDAFPNIIFGSLTGTFILAYIILWMVLPEARSPYEKMEMRGEKVDVNTIRQNVKEGMENVKERVSSWSGEVKESAKNLGNKAKEFSQTRGRAFAREVGDTARRGGTGLGHAIGVLIKVFLLFIAGTIAFGIFIAIIALIFSGVAWWPINNFLWTSDNQQFYAWATLIFFLAVPLVAFITWLVRRILRVRSRNNYLGWIFGFLWLIGWISAVLFASSVSKDFRSYEHADTVIPVSQPASGKLIVTVSQPVLEYSGNFGWFDTDGEEGWDLSEDTLRISRIKFNIIASKDSSYHVSLRKHGYGQTDQEAIERAERILYPVYSRDSVLDLANGYAIARENKFRFQHVELEIQVPVGKKIRFDRSVKEKLNPSNFKVKRSYYREKGVEIKIDDGYSFRFRSDVDYLMGIDGQLKDMSGNTVVSDGYRHEEKPDSLSIEQQRKKVEEEQRKLKEMEDKRKVYKLIPQQRTVQKSKVEKDAIASSPSPVFSLVNLWN